MLNDLNGQKVLEFELYNDGLHEDESAGDQIFATTFKITNKGTYILKIGDSTKNITVSDIRALELYPGQNAQNENRINMILIGSNYPSIEVFTTLAKKILAINGEINTQIINGIDSKKGAFQIEQKSVGFFATEPLKTNKNKFNIWYLNQQINTSILETLENMGLKSPDSFLNLNNTYFAVLSNKEFEGSDVYRSDPTRSHTDSLPLVDENGNVDWFGTSLNYFPLLQNFSRVENDGTIIRTEYVSNSDTLTNYQLFSHESGHALFGLLDEYAETDTPIIRSPNCAQNIDEANLWWSDLEGQVDPFYYTYKDAFPESTLQESDLTVGYFTGGCFGSTNSNVIRPTKDSMMNVQSKAPIFGSVNRRQIENILSNYGVQ